MLAQLTSWVANTGFRTAEKPTTVQDFMPTQWANKARTGANKAKSNAPAVRMNRKRRQHLMDALNNTLGLIARKTN
jgi:hypothetical protein